VSFPENSQAIGPCLSVITRWNGFVSDHQVEQADISGI
jgi:hypothetical protein